MAHLLLILLKGILVSEFTLSILFVNTSSLAVSCTTSLERGALWSSGMALIYHGPVFDFWGRVSSDENLIYFFFIFLGGRGVFLLFCFLLPNPMVARI